MDTALDAVEAQIARGELGAARRHLTAIDQTYGAFAAPRLLTLADRCACGLPGATGP